jgi:hypothetical protein
MSGIYPSTPAFLSIKISSIQPTLVSISHSLARQARSRGGQRWLIEGTYPKHLLREEFAPLIAFSLKQRGQFDTFQIILPKWSTARGIATGTPTVDGASQAGRVIHTKGWTPSQTGILLAGDFIKFAGHDKVYMMTVDANSNSLGLADLNIEPALLKSPNDSETLIVTDVPFCVAFAKDLHEWIVHAPLFNEFEVSFVEAW